MSHRFPPLRPPAPAQRPPVRSQTAPGVAFVDLMLLAALVLSVALALI
jgi:hypothetical protein